MALYLEVERPRRIRSGQIKRPDLLGSPAISPYDFDFEGTRVKAKIAGHEETGTVSQVPWSVVDGLTRTYERNQYRNSCMANALYKIKNALPD